jgi:Archaeal PaREP1/PaREP8 family.
VEITKPWLDDKKYKQDRLLEAKYEAELAKKFLENGLFRNAAGKAFQAWKALLAAFSVDYIEEFSKFFKGKKRMRDGRIVSYAEWIIATMPTSKMSSVAQILDNLLKNDIEAYTDIAIKLHEFQYNGLDKSGEMSRYPSIEFMKMDLEKLLKAIEKFLSHSSLEK